MKGPEGENELNISSDSKISRERSREEVKLEQDSSQSDISHEAIKERGALFSGVFEINANLMDAADEEEEAVENKILNLYVSDETPEDKEMKRTWEEEYEVIDGQISIGKLMDEDLGCENRDNWWLNSMEGTPCKEMFPIGLDTILRLEKNENIHPIPQLQEIQEIEEVRCGQYDKLMIDDWLFQGRWGPLDE